MQGRTCALQKQPKMHREASADSVIVHCLSITATTDVVSGSVAEQPEAYAEPPGTPGMYDDDADDGTPQGSHPSPGETDGSAYHGAALEGQPQSELPHNGVTPGGGDCWLTDTNAIGSVLGIDTPDQLFAPARHDQLFAPALHDQLFAHQQQWLQHAMHAMQAGYQHASQMHLEQEHEALEERKKNSMTITTNQKRLGIAKRPLVSPLGGPARLTPAGLRWRTYAALTRELPPPGLVLPHQRGGTSGPEEQYCAEIAASRRMAKRQAPQAAPSKPRKIVTAVTPIYKVRPYQPTATALEEM